jgi:hypothetical protein
MSADFVTETRELASEIKFLIDSTQAHEIREWARIHLQSDPHADADTDSYQTTSIYFDTPEFDIYHRRGSFGRGKYRIRRYGQAREVFLERKLRNKNLVAKRRSLVPLEDIERLEESETEDSWSGHWFHRRLLARELHPVCQIGYLRTARVAVVATGPIRLTIDQQVRASALDRIAFQSTEGSLLSPGQMILELKFRRSLPVPFKELIGTFNLRSSPVSKYRLAAEALGIVEGQAQEKLEPKAQERDERSLDTSPTLAGVPVASGVKDA